MSQKDTVLTEKTKHTGIFNFTELYNYIYDWFSGEGYIIVERKYSEKIIGESKALEVDWICEKRVNDYFKFQIKSLWLINGLKKVEVKKGDEKITMNSGTIEIKWYARLIKDYENRWESHPFWKFLRGIYNRYIMRKRIDYYEDAVEDELSEIVTQTKAFLALEGKRG